jgi:hypothetical protein
VDAIKPNQPSKNISLGGTIRGLLESAANVKGLTISNNKKLLPTYGLTRLEFDTLEGYLTLHLLYALDDGTLNFIKGDRHYVLEQRDLLGVLDTRAHFPFTHNLIQNWEDELRNRWLNEYGNTLHYVQGSHASVLLNPILESILRKMKQRYTIDGNPEQDTRFVPKDAELG